jgi:hypothetical protein
MKPNSDDAPRFQPLGTAARLHGCTAARNSVYVMCVRCERCGAWVHGPIPLLEEFVDGCQRSIAGGSLGKTALEEQAQSRQLLPPSVNNKHRSPPAPHAAYSGRGASQSLSRSSVCATSLALLEQHEVSCATIAIRTFAQRAGLTGYRRRALCCPWSQHNQSNLQSATPVRPHVDNEPARLCHPQPQWPFSRPPYTPNPSPGHTRRHASSRRPPRRPDQCRLHVTALERPEKYLTHPIGEVKCHARPGPWSPYPPALSTPARDGNTKEPLPDGALENRSARRRSRLEGLGSGPPALGAGKHLRDYISLRQSCALPPISRSHGRLNRQCIRPWPPRHGRVNVSRSETDRDTSTPPAALHTHTFKLERPPDPSRDTL